MIVKTVLCTESYRPILNLFLQSKPDSIDCEVIDLSSDPEFVYMKGIEGSEINNYHEIILKLSFFKMKLFYETIRDNMGKNFVYLAANAVFFKDFTDDLNDRLNKTEMLFGKEVIDKDLLNCGLVAMKCNENTLLFWQTMMLNHNNNYYRFENEQNIVNNVLRNNLYPYQINYDHLPYQYWANCVPYDINDIYRFKREDKIEELGDNVNKNGYITLDDIVERIPKDSFIYRAVAIDGGAVGRYSVLKYVLDNFKPI